MDRILCARLVWIYSTDNYKQTSESDNEFTRLIKKGDEDEFDPSYYEQIKRGELLSDKIILDGCELSVCVVKNDYKKYQYSLIHIVLEIDTASGVDIETFAKLIHGSSILDRMLVKKHSGIRAFLSNNGIELSRRSFLINQIRRTCPPLPDDDDTDSSMFIQQNLQLVTQMVLRSDTEPNGLSPENHREYLNNISSFKGSVDLCSGRTLIQFHFFDIKSLDEGKIIDADTRLSWMCSVLTMVSFQSLILKGAINKIDKLSPLGAKEKVKGTKELEKLLIDLKEYWDVDAMIHPMTARKVNLYKDRLGVSKQFEILHYRMESTEHLATRELYEVQNEQDQMLNYILLFIASVQLIPLVHTFMENLVGSDTVGHHVINYSTTTFLSVFIPLLILKNRSIRKRIESSYRKKRSSP